MVQVQSSKPREELGYMLGTGLAQEPANMFQLYS